MWDVAPCSIVKADVLEVRTASISRAIEYMFLYVCVDRLCGLVVIIIIIIIAVINQCKAIG
jgi:hypothetical protein